LTQVFLHNHTSCWKKASMTPSDQQRRTFPTYNGVCFEKGFHMQLEQCWCSPCWAEWYDFDQQCFRYNQWLDNSNALLQVQYVGPKAHACYCFAFGLCFIGALQHVAKTILAISCKFVHEMFDQASFAGILHQASIVFPLTLTLANFCMADSKKPWLSRSMSTAMYQFWCL